MISTTPETAWEAGLAAEPALPWEDAHLPQPTAAGKLVAFSLPAPLVYPEDWLKSVEGEDCFAWLPPERNTGAPPDAWVGWGVSAELRGHGQTRFAQLKEQSSRLRERLSWPEEQPPPRFFGGLAFAPGQGQAEPWKAFGDASFVLPRLAYQRLGSEAWFRAVVPSEELATTGSRRRLLQELRGLRSRLPSRGDPLQESATQLLDRERPDRSEFAARVANIQARIYRGELGKLVTASQARVRLESPPSVRQVLLNLRKETQATRFAFQRGRSCFLGAAPETLIKKQGREFETEAVAGSIRANLPEAAALLLSSQKDRREHAFVVEALLEGLGPLAIQLTHSPEPTLRRLRRVLHLLTPIAGRLDQDHPILELVERLHPTPAVAGTPRQAALSAIDQLEPVPRGWYSAPVGWFDVLGNGSFAVALRSGVLEGSRAHLWAGAGIVGESETDPEYDEIELKLTTLLSALGIDD